MRALMTPTPSELSAASSPGDAGPAFEGADDLGSLAFAVAQNLRLAGLASGESLPPPLPDADAPAEGPFYRNTGPDANGAPRATGAGEGAGLGLGAGAGLGGRGMEGRFEPSSHM